MIVRGLTVSGDWLFGKGTEDYKSGNQAIAQSIQTRLLMFLNDCFFAMSQGIDWFNLLGNKNQLALNLAVSSTILETDGVTSLQQLSINLDASRNLSINYTVTTALTGNSNALAGSVAYLVTEAGDFLTDESGNRLIL